MILAAQDLNRISGLASTFEADGCGKAQPW
jgi:hypothetical protein